MLLWISHSIMTKKKEEVFNDVFFSIAKSENTMGWFFMSLSFGHVFSHVTYDFIVENKVFNSTFSLVLIAIGGVWSNILSLKFYCKFTFWRVNINNSSYILHKFSVHYLLWYYYSSSFKNFEPILIILFKPLTIEEK